MIKVIVLLINGSSGELQIQGIIRVTGDIHIYCKKKPLIYQGNGTLYATDDIHVHSDVMPNTSFPLVDSLGLIAAKIMWIACGSGDSQLTMALAMYAQYKITINKQCEIGGTCVSSYFAMNNVPHIYQVPELVNNLPPGMPGGEPINIVTISVKSWQDVGGSGS